MLCNFNYVSLYRRVTKEHPPPCETKNTKYNTIQKQNSFKWKMCESRRQISKWSELNSMRKWFIKGSNLVNNWKKISRRRRPPLQLSSYATAFSFVELWLSRKLILPEFKTPLHFFILEINSYFILYREKVSKMPLRTKARS